jgi:RNase H-fold protein (predicted Holliday junction resolvase)
MMKVKHDCEGGVADMAKSKKKASEKAQDSGKRNPVGIVAGFRQIVQDLLVPELKAIQVTLQHHGELIQGLQRQMETMQKQMDERFTAMQRQMDERFTAMQRQMDERFTAMQRQMDERLTAMQRQMDERFAAMQQQNAEEFAKIWKAITELLEAQQHNQVILQRILDRLDVTEMVRETQTRQKVIEAQTEQLRKEVAHLRRLLEMAMQQRGIQPTTP